MFNIVLLQHEFIWNTPLLIGLLGLAFIYLMTVYRLSKLKFYNKQPLFFLLSVFLLYLILGSPFAVISHLSFSLHMIGMSILYFIIPPLFLLGIPQTTLRKSTTIPFLCRLCKWSIPSRLALIVFAGLFFIYHLPFVYNLLSQHSFLHNGYSVLLLLLALSMWWPIVTPDSNKQLKDRKLKQYVTLSGLLLMPACLILIVSALIDGSNNPFLAQITAQLCLPTDTTISLNILPPPFNTKYDQATAGFVMLGIHKLALVATSKQRNKATNRLHTKNQTSDD